jgi:hypothetical protein
MMRHRSHCFAFACRSFGFGFTYCELYCLKVVKLVLDLFVINYDVDLMMCMILMLCMIYFSIVCLFWRPPVQGGSQNKQ